jgi:hypothetical protein
MRFGVVMVTPMIVIWLDLSSLASRNVNLVSFWAVRRETSAPGGGQGPHAPDAEPGKHVFGT